MKTYMPLNGLRWSRNSGSANCDMPQSAVFGRPGGGCVNMYLTISFRYGKHGFHRFSLFFFCEIRVFRVIRA